MFVLLILVAAALFGWNALFRRIWLNNLEIRLEFTEGVVYAGTRAELTEVISNRKRLPLAELEVGFRVPKGVSFLDAENIIISDYVYKRDIFSLRGMEAVTRRYHLTCMKRGHFPISQVTLHAWSFFHGSEYVTDMDQVTDELTVYAARTDISNLLSACDTILGTVESAGRLYEDPFAFASIREYTTRDPMKTVNWKASARMGELMVNTYSSVKSEQFYVFLDVTDDRILKEEDLVEKGISVAATLCQRLIRRGLEIGLAVNTDPPAVFEPQRGQDQLRRIEQFLTTDFSQGKTIPFDDLTRMPMQTQGRICVFISKDWKPSGRRSDRNEKQNLETLLAVPVKVEGVPVLRVRRLGDESREV